MRWTPELVAQAAAVFRSHSDYALAIDEVQRTVRDCSESGLRSAFKAAGLPSPVMLLRPSLRVNVTPPLPAPPLAPTDVAPPCDSGVEQSYPPCSPEQVEEIERACVTMPRECEPVRRDKTYIIFPDAHHPEVDPDAWKLALRVADFVEANSMLVLGDFGDLAAVSTHRKSPDKLAAFAEELRLTNEALDELDALGIEEKHFLGGNHESRGDRYVKDNAPAFHQLESLSIPALFNLKSRGWGYTPYMGTHMIGSTHCSHDFGDSGAYATKRASEATDSSTVSGHTHRVHRYSSVSRRTGRNIESVSLGWLGKYESIDYYHRAKAVRDWAHAVGFGRLKQDGELHVEIVRFVNGRAFVDGQRV